MRLSKIIIFLALFIKLFILDEHNGICTIYIPKKTETIKQVQFLGTWRMQTLVTKSNCPYVLTGSATESILEIRQLKIKNKVNKFKAFWSGGKWSSSHSIIKPLNEKEAITERYTELKMHDNNIWKTILIDHFYLEENDLMRLESLATQYKNGNPVGEYKTISILTKLQ